MVSTRIFKKLYYTYILFSTERLRYYSGSTDNIEKRVIYHNSTKRGFTSKGQPWIPLYVKAVANRSEAVKLGYKIKRRGAKRYLLDWFSRFIHIGLE